MHRAVCVSWTAAQDVQVRIEELGAVFFFYVGVDGFERRLKCSVGRKFYEM